MFCCVVLSFGDVGSRGGVGGRGQGTRGDEGRGTGDGGRGTGDGGRGTRDGGRGKGGQEVPLVIFTAVNN